MDTSLCITCGRASASVFSLNQHVSSFHGASFYLGDTDTGNVYSPNGVIDTTPEAPAYVSADDDDDTFSEDEDEVENTAYAMNENYDYNTQELAYRLNMRLTESLLFSPNVFSNNTDRINWFLSF